MRIIHDSRFRRFRATTLVCAAVAAGVFTVAGCGKKQATAAQTQPTAENYNPAASPTYVRPATPVVVPAEAAGQPDLKMMTHTLRSWVARTHIVPKSFEDFVAQANVQFPAPPEGKKFVIGKRMMIELAKR